MSAAAGGGALREAPLRRRPAAGAVDMAIHLALFAPMWRAVARGERPAELARAQRAALFALWTARECGASPGMLAAGLERRDRRSGARLAPWRAVLARALDQVPGEVASRVTRRRRSRERAQRAASHAAFLTLLRELLAQGAEPRDAFARARASAGGPVSLVSGPTTAMAIAIPWCLRRALAPLRRRLVGDAVTVAR